MNRSEEPEEIILSDNSEGNNSTADDEERAIERSFQQAGEYINRPLLKEVPTPRPERAFDGAVIGMARCLDCKAWHDRDDLQDGLCRSCLDEREELEKAEEDQTLN